MCKTFNLCNLLVQFTIVIFGVGSLLNCLVSSNDGVVAAGVELLDDVAARCAGQLTVQQARGNAELTQKHA